MFHRRSLAPAQDSSWLLLRAEPYYNPVNLEKAGTRVKQKEFLSHIGISGPPAASPHFRSGPQARDILFRPARLASPGPRFAAPHRNPLPPVHPTKPAHFTTSPFPPPPPPPQSP